MKKLLTFVLLLTITNSRAQKEADNWFFGVNAGITFNTTPATFLPGGQINTYEGCASISDAAGNLLFYTDGATVWDRNHNVMPNGTGLLGLSSTSQSSVIFSMPGSTTLFYIFTAPVENSMDSLCYSIVDITLNGGMGNVTVKNIGLLANSTEKLTATLHSNGTDVWVVGHEFNTANFYAWVVTATGVNAVPVISMTGSVHGSSNNAKEGYHKISPCGSKLASAVTPNYTAELFDFDNATGVVSNPVMLGNWTGISTYGIYGVEFSPDNSRLYIAVLSPPVIIQYNLLAGSNAAIIASADTIGISGNQYSGALQLGPDGKIYMAKFFTGSLSCITNPNILGAACNFVDSHLSLSSGSSNGGLPNFLTSYFCGLNVSTNNPNTTNSVNSLYPNPASTSLTVSLNANTTGSTHISIVNTLGANVYNETIPASPSAKEVTIPLTNFSKGVYFLKVQLKDGVEVRKFVVE